MKNTKNKMMALIMAAAVITTAFTGCKSKPKDADVKAGVETAIQSSPTSTNVTVSVDQGVATLTGQVPDQGSKDSLEKTAAAVAGVKSVINNLTIAAAPAVSVAMDDPLAAAVKDATKDYPTVTSTVADGVISLKGEIQKANLQKLMMTLQALKPKKVETAGLTVK